MSEYDDLPHQSNHDVSSNSGDGDMPRRRQFLLWVTATVGVIGTGIATWPFLSSFMPSARARALGSPVKIDFSKLDPGEQLAVKWRGVPIWVLRRTPEMMDWLASEELRAELRDPDSEVLTQQPKYANNAGRSIKSEYLVAIGICTHLGCVPTFRPDMRPRDLGEEWMGGYFCPCHKSKFDLAGRVYKGVPAPTNLVIPPHRYLDATTIEIGVDTKV